MNDVTRRTQIFIVIAELCAVLAAATTVGAALTLAFVALCLIGSTSVVRQLAASPGLRLVPQLLMVIVTMVVLLQLQHVQPDLLTTKLLPLLLALLVLRIPMAQTRRDVAVDLILAAMVLVVCAAVVNTFDGGLPLLLAWPALLAAAVAVHHDGLTTGDVTVATRTSSNRPFAQSIYAVPVALACALGLVAWLLLPSGESASLREKLGVKHSAAFGSTANPFGGKPGQRVPAAYTAGQLDLSLRGALPTDPVLRVPASSPELWRVQVFSVYDGRFWTARRQNPQLVSGGPVHTLPATQEVFDTKGFAREDVAEPLGPATDAPVWSPGLPMAVETRGQVIIDSVGVAHVLGIRQAPAYSVRSIAPEIEISQLRAASGADPSDPAWVTVPAVPERVRTLAKAITSGSSDRYTAMRKVESWLRGHILYDLDAPVPAAGKDSVDSMLFETHRGFCEHFASAEAVLLRTLGIPARVVSGLAGGNPSGSVPGTREFLADDAHAWVEVYFPGVGWVNSDPTAGAKLASAADEQNVVASVVASFRQMLNQLASMPGGRRTLGLMVAALVVLALLFGRRPRRAAVVRARRTTGRHGPVLVAFLTFEQRRRAQRERSVAESPREYVAATGELTALGEAVTVLEEECYGRRPPVGAVAVAAAAAFESATPVLPQP